MATGRALICKLGNHIEILGADRIVQVDMFGETIITQKENEEGIIGLLFDMDTCLSHEFSKANNMYRHSELNEDKSVKGYLEDDRRIRPVRLKGVKCSALFLPIDSLEFTGISYESIGKDKQYIGIGQEIDEINGVKICEKYISKSTRKAMVSNKGGKVRQNLVPTFKEHLSTDQWDRNKDKLQSGDLVYITEKLHGTSGRCGYLKVEKPATKWEKFISNYITSPLILGRIGKFKNWTNYEFCVGSRKVVKSVGNEEVGNKQHYYEEDLWTKISKEYFEGKLRKSESVYFEIVGYTPSGELIMPSVSNKKLEKFMDKKEYKEFIKRYGETTTFDYGCIKPFSHGSMIGDFTNAYKVFVYRITMTNEDGDSIDLSWEQVKRRCEQLGVSHVPELSKNLINDLEIDGVKGLRNSVGTPVDKIVKYHTNKQSVSFPQHIREGVCIRVENGSMTPYILKSKNYHFKVLEGIIKDSDVVDIEESN